MFSRCCSLTSIPNSPDFPQHLNADLISSFTPNQAYLLFSLAGAGLPLKFLLYRSWWLQATKLKSSYKKNVINRDLWSVSFSLTFCSSLVLQPQLLLYWLPWVSHPSLQVPSSALCRDSLFCLIIHPQKSPTQRPPNVCFLPCVLPCALFSKTKGKEIKNVKKVSWGVGWHIQKHL